MNRFLTLLITLCLLLPAVGHAAAPTVITTNAPTEQTEAPAGATPFDSCRSGDYPGIGWNDKTKRWNATCGTFNFGKFQGFDKAAYWVECTGLAAPHRSCLRAGERRQIGALYSLGLAPFYTEDGGTVYVPNSEGKDHAILVDVGCGPDSAGTAIECPQPYDPERVAITDARGRSVFSKIGYSYRVELIRGGQRRVNIVFENSPAVKDELSNTPRLIGGWLVNDRGNDPAGPAAAARSGSNSSYIGDWIFGAGYSSYTSGIGYCRQEGTASSFKCDLNPSDRGTSGWAGNQTMSMSPYGVVGRLAASIDTNSGEQISGAFHNSIGTCANNAAEPCNADGDCASGTCTIGASTTSATCQYDRQIRCWNTATNAARSAGGCLADDGSVDLGLCQGFVDALQYDMETGNGSQKEQYGLYATYGACDLGPEDSASDAACAAGSFNHPIGIRSFDQTLTTRCTGAIAEGCKEINFGTNQKHPTDTSGVYGGASFEQRHIPTGLGTAASDASFIPITRRSFNLNNKGIENAGFMPSDWYGKTTCLSGNNTSSANDEVACDTAAILGVMPGMNGLIKNMFVFNSSGYNKTDIDGDLGAYYPTYDGGVVMLARRNGWADPNTGWTYKNIDWLYNYATSTAINFFGPRGFLLNNRFIGNQAAPLIYIGSSAAAQSIVIDGNEFNSFGANSGSMIWVSGGRGHRITNNFSYGFSESFIRLFPGGAAGASARKFVKDVVIRDNHIRLDGSSSAGVIYIACSDDAATNNEFVQNALIDGNYAQVATNNYVPFVRVQDTDAANCRVLENLGSVHITNNQLDERFGGCIFADRGTCQTATGNVWGPKDASDFTLMAASSNMPFIQGNSVLGLPVPDFPFHPTAAASVSTCTKMGPGAIAAIYDDTVARGTCTDTVPGTLTGGGTFLSVCKCNSAGAWVEF